jgi:hypothetical protein
MQCIFWHKLSPIYISIISSYLSLISQVVSSLHVFRMKFCIISSASCNFHFSRVTTFIREPDMTYSAVKQIASVFSIKLWQIIGLTVLVISITLSILLYRGTEADNDGIYNSIFYVIYILCQQGKCTCVYICIGDVTCLPIWMFHMENKEQTLNYLWQL